jgi:hypothetical protein
MKRNTPSSLRTSRLPEPTACAACGAARRRGAGPGRGAAGGGGGPRPPPAAGEPGQRLGDVGELVEPQGVLAALPQPQRERGDRVPQLVEAESGGPAGAAADTLLLVAQPGGEDLLVEAGGAEGAAGARDRAQLVVVEVGDEAEQPGVAAQGEQVGDGVEESHPAVGGAVVAFVAVDQVGADLLRGELLDGQHPPVREQADALTEGGEHLTLRAEVLGAAADDDLGAVDGGVQQHLEAFGGAVVGDLVDQFVEAVEEQHDPALLEHVPEGAQVDGVDAVGGEVGGDQPLEGVGPVQGVQLHQQRYEVGEFGRDAAGQLAQREGLAVSEVAEEQQEAALVGVEEAEHVVDQAVAVLGTEAFHLAVPLRQVHARRVAGVGAQPLALGGDVSAQVEQALELGEAAYADASAAGQVAQFAGGRRAVVDEFGLGLGVRRVDEGDDPVDVLGGRGAGVHGDPLLADEARLLPGDEQLRHRSGHRADLGALVPGPADLGDTGEERLGRGLDRARLGFRRSAGIRRGLVGLGLGRAGPERAMGPPPFQLPPLRLPGPLPGREPVAADAQQPVPAGPGGAEQRQLAGGGGQAGTGPGARGAVQEQVQPGRGETGQDVGVAQRPAPVRRTAASAPGRMPQRPDPQPPLLLVRPQRLGEPGRLLGPDQAVLVVEPVAVGHRRVQARDHRVQLGHGEEGPRLVAVEDDVQALVQLLEEPGEVPPLGPVRRPGRHLVGLAGAEVGPAGRLVDVPAAGDEGDPVRFEAEEGAQPGEEGERLVELAGAAGGGQVTGDHQQVGGGGARVGQLDEVAPDRRLQLGRILTPSEGGPGELEHGDRLTPPCAPGHPWIRRWRRGPAPPGPAGPPERPAGSGRHRRRRGRSGQRAAAARVVGPQTRPGTAVEGLADPGEEQVAGGGRVGDGDQIDVRDGGEQALHGDVLDPYGDQAALGGVRVGTQGRLPLHPSVARPLVVARENGDDGGGFTHAPVHEVHEVGARDEVPRLEDRAVAGLLQGPGDPRRPALVGR